MPNHPPEYVIAVTPEQRQIIVRDGELIYQDEEVAHYKFNGKIYVVEPDRPK